MLNIECLRVCDGGSAGGGGWSVEVRTSLESVVGAGELALVDIPTWECVGTSTCSSASREAGGEESSGFAMRKPPRDWDRLKSPSMTPGSKVRWLWPSRSLAIS
jgi:hypothetical protein